MMITATVLTLLYYVQLEFSIANQEKIDLTDKYSHDMGNSLQTIMLTIGILRGKKFLKDKEPINLLKTIEEKVGEVNKLLEEIRQIK